MLLAAVVILSLLLAACGVTPPGPSASGAPTPTAGPERQLTIRAVSRATGDPVPEVSIEVAGATADAPEGSVTMTSPQGVTAVLRAEGFDDAQAAIPASGDLTVEMRPNTVSGTAMDEAGHPIVGARVFVDGQDVSVRTDRRGRYLLHDVPEQGALIVKRAGYRLGQIPLEGQTELDVTLTPFVARALYSPGAVFEGVGRLDQQLDMIERTEANAMVIDVKETGGYLYYETDLPAAVESGATRRPIFRLEDLLPKLKERGIYTIARMVVMKDNTVGASRPELAVRNTATGRPWTDYGGGIWLDPYNPGVAEYIAAIAGDLADKGFDEVQLDYVRFFSDGDYSVAEPNLPNTQSFRLPAIRRLFRLVADRLDTTHAFLAADVFPISFIAADDQGIGQRPEVIMPYVDYFSPMVYPSHYANGTFGFAVPNDHPYQVIDRTLRIMNRQSEGLPMVIRPWIQDFGLPGQRTYTAADVRAEMKALADNGAQGWMIWNAAARFTASALGPPREGEDAGPAGPGQ